MVLKAVTCRLQKTVLQSSCGHEQLLLSKIGGFAFCASVTVEGTFDTYPAILKNQCFWIAWCPGKLVSSPHTKDLPTPVAAFPFKACCAMSDLLLRLRSF